MCILPCYQSRRWRRARPPHPLARLLLPFTFAALRRLPPAAVNDGRRSRKEQYGNEYRQRHPGAGAGGNPENAGAGRRPAAGTAAAHAPAPDDDAPVETRSALSDATARLGGQLDAQADASRVDRARAEAATPPDDAPPPAADTDAAAEGKATATTGGARPTGGGASAGTTNETESGDYIAEADTNSDKKVSDQERIAYEKKLEQQARDEAVQKAYGLAETGEPAVNASA